MLAEHIFLLIHDITGKGGTERVVINLANAFAPLCKVGILSLSKNFDAPNYEINGEVEIKYLEPKIVKNMQGNFWQKMLCSFQVNSEIKKLMAQSGAQNAALIDNSNLIPYFKLANVGYVRLIHASFYALFSKYAAPKYEQNPPIKRFFKPRIAKFDCIVALSANTLDLYKRIHQNPVLIPNFLPQMPDTSTNLDSKIVLAAGRLSKEKGFLRLVEVWGLLWQSSESKNLQNLNGWELHIIGEGEQEAEIRKAIENLDSENARKSIKLLPFTKKIQKHYLQASIYVMTSFSEGLPMVLVEAGSYGIPSIAFNIASGPKDIITDSENGLLIDDGDLQDFADKLYLLISDSELRKKLGANAKTKIQNNFSQQAVLPKWLEIL